MKKIYLLIILLATTGTLAAQSLIGTNATIWNAGDGSTYVDAFVDIHNVSNNTIDVLVERKSEILTTGHVSNFCWGIQCYPPPISLSPAPEPIAAGTVNSSFKGQLNPNGIPGLSRVAYCFFNQANAADSVCFEFFYNIVLGVNETGSAATYLSDPTPNPANTLTAFSYRIKDPKGEIKMVIRNLLGQVVQEINLGLPAKNFILNTASLPQGWYFCSLMNGNQILRTTRLSVVH